MQTPSAQEPPDSLNSVRERWPRCRPSSSARTSRRNWRDLEFGSCSSPPAGRADSFWIGSKIQPLPRGGIFQFRFFSTRQFMGIHPPADTRISKAWAIRLRCFSSRWTNIYQAESNFASARKAAGKASWPLTGWSRTSPCFVRFVWKGSSLHNYWADCVRSRSEYSDFAHHDGDGENPRHRRPYVHGHTQSPGAPFVYHTRTAELV